jgi:hypothetical protein
MIPKYSLVLQSNYFDIAKDKKRKHRNTPSPRKSWWRLIAEMLQPTE